MFDPFRKEKETNVYSWKANNGFKFREMIPAVSLTLGTNINFEKNNPFPYNNVFGNLYRPIFFQNLEIKPDQEPFFHFGGTIATQSHFLGTWVFVTNFNYSRYLTKYPEMSYILTLTHTLDSYWSVYIENQAFKSDLFQDFIFRFGTAYLLSNDIQLEATFGASTKNTPSSILANIGVSYRLDFHKDFISAEEKQEKEFRKQEKNLNKSLKKVVNKKIRETEKLKEIELMTKKIDIKEVITEKDYFAFVKFPFSLYNNNPYWVPPLIKDEIETLDPNKNPVYKNSSAKLF